MKKKKEKKKRRKLYSISLNYTTFYLYPVDYENVQYTYSLNYYPYNTLHPS